MTTDNGTIHILPNQMGFAAAVDQMPQLQPVNLKLFTAVPSPAPQGDGPVRESTVVDGAIQQQNAAPDNAAPATPILRPDHPGSRADHTAARVLMRQCLERPHRTKAAVHRAPRS